MADTANLALPLMEAAQSQKHVTHNEALLILDAVVQLSVIDDDLTAPPGGAVDGDRYIVGSGATGAWDDKDLNIAVRLDGAWTFLVPKDGWICWVEDSGSLFVWVTSAWVDFGAASGLVGSSSLEDGSILELGVNTASSTTNRLAVKSDAVLFSHDDVTPGTGDLRVTLNKSAAGKDAGFTFQDAFSTRALFGLLGDDDFTFKVSPDGSTFFTALTIDKDTGHLFGPVEVSKNAGALPTNPTNTVLRVSGEDGQQARLVFDTFGSNGNFIFRASGGTASAPSGMLATTRIGQFSAFGYGTTGYTAASKAQIAFEASENWTDTANGVRIVFQTTPTGSASAVSNVTIEPGGYLNVGTTGDTNNRVSAKGTSFLFDAQTDDCRFTFNKVASGDDVALTFQSGYSARALVGLLGDDDFTFKVSPNGSTYYPAMVIDKDDGSVNLPAGAKFSAYCNFGQDYTAGAWQSLFANNTRHNDQSAFASVSNVGIFTAPTPGYYVFGLGVTYEAGSAPTKMSIGLSINNATPTSDTIGTTGDATFVSGETATRTGALLKLAAGDTVRGKIFFTTNNGRVLADENYFWGARVA